MIRFSKRTNVTRTTPPFIDFFRHLKTQPANHTNPKTKKQPKNKPKKFIKKPCFSSIKQKQLISENLENHASTHYPQSIVQPIRNTK
jgi:hypothetical protein